MKYTHILWDFNGTLYNDVDAAIKSANVLLERRGLPLMGSVEEYHSKFCFPIIEYYRNIGLDFSIDPFEELSKEWMEQYRIHSRRSALYDGVTELLSQFRQRQVSQIVLSATERGMLLEQLADLQILQYFDEVLGLDDIHANSKVGIANGWVRQNPTARALMLGDSVHDYEVARHIGADCILISASHQSQKALKACGVKVVDDIKELYKTITAALP